MDQLQPLAQWRQAGIFNEIERAILDGTEAMPFSGGKVTDDHVIVLRRSSRFNSALDIAPQGFCVLPAATQTTGQPEPGRRNR